MSHPPEDTKSFTFGVSDDPEEELIATLNPEEMLDGRHHQLLLHAPQAQDEYLKQLQTPIEATKRVL